MLPVMKTYVLTVSRSYSNRRRDLLRGRATSARSDGSAGAPFVAGSEGVDLGILVMTFAEAERRYGSDKARPA